MIIEKIVTDQLMLENKPLIAICLASFNGEKYIEMQLESIFMQGYQDFKLYIADDKSTDNTIRIIKIFQEHFPGRIVLIVNNKRLGVVKNFETLLYHCKEKYIAISDQDDIWERDKLTLQMRAMLKLEKESKACLVHSNLSMIDENSEITAKSYFGFRGYKLNDEKDLGHILGPCGVMGNTLLINRELCNQALPFPDKLEVHDYWLAIIAELYGKRKTLEESLVKYRIHNNNVSNSKQSIQSSHIDKRWLTWDIKLPYLESKRHFIMLDLLKKEMKREDRETIETFYKYLTFRKNKYKMYLDLLRYSLVKKSIWYRVKLFVKLVLTKRYS